MLQGHALWPAKKVSQWFGLFLFLFLLFLIPFKSCKAKPYVGLLLQYIVRRGVTSTRWALSNMIRVIFLTLSIWCIIRSLPCLLCIFCSEVRCSGDDPICWQDRALILNRGDLSDYLRIAAELGTHRITVNGYCPGNIDTPMSSSFHPKLILEWFSYLCVWSAQHDSDYCGEDGCKSRSHQEAGKHLWDSSWSCHLVSSTKGSWRCLLHQFDSAAVLGYHGEPSDVASLVSYLASAESHFITGMIHIHLL